MTTATTTASVSPVSPRRRNRSLPARLALAVAAPLVFFVGLEYGLRLGGFGRETDFLISDGQPGIYRTNPHFAELFLPASFGLKPVNFRLARIKPVGSYRVFVIGESAAMGVPEPAFSIAPQLQAQLRATLPGRRIDVFNLGLTAINSHAILQIVRQAVEFQPDLLVIYMGNNEVVGPYGPGSVVTGYVPPRWQIRLGLWLRSTRTGQLVQRILDSLHPAGSGFRDWRGMEMFAEKVIEASDPRLAAVRANFAANLSDLLAAARAAHAKAILSTVVVNVRDCAPFASRHRPGLAPAQLDDWRRSEEQAVRAAELGRPDEARRLLEHALAIDPAHAGSHFRLARLLETSGDLPAARRHYFAALEEDTLRFRADAEINNVIRQAAAADPRTATLVDAARELGSDPSSAAAPAGAGLFFEHVHLRWEGNYALVRLLAPVAWGLLHGGVADPPAWLDSAACADAVGYTALGRYAMLQSMAALTDRPPFTGQSSFAEDRARLTTEIAATAAALDSPGAVAAAVATIDGAVRRDPQNPLLLFQAAAARLHSGDFKGALELNGRLGTESPFSPEQAAQRAFLLQQVGRVNDAEELLLRSAGAAPYYFQTYGLLAQLWAAMGRTTTALAYFRTLVARMPDSPGARAAYAQLLAQQGEWAAAEHQWRTILRLVPDDEAALVPLLKLLQQRGRSGEARPLMAAAYAYNPRDYANNSRLAQISEGEGDLAHAVIYLQALAESGPVNARLYADLARALGKLGRREEMRVAITRALRKARDEGDAAVLEEVEEMARRDGQ